MTTEQHPVVRRDQGYYLFLERYCGARVVSNENNIVIHIWGLSDASLHLLDDPGDIVEEGCFGFGATEFWVNDIPSQDNNRILGFGFDVTGTRPFGIYRMICYPESRPQRHRGKYR